MTQSSTTVTGISYEEAVRIAERACPDNPAERELVIKEQMGTIGAEERLELQRIRRCVC